MDGSVKIKKGLQKEVLFYNLKAKYINYFIGVGFSIVLIGVLLSIVVSTYLAGSLMIILIIVSFSIFFFYSKTYGENGFIKKMADRKMPSSIKLDQKFSNLLLWKKK
ncbi:protein of unknown function [Tenacibaculum sp. MAR_2009_124]|uniref:DUF4133 domain-containing protein n=1 Tax=Tenacibaculum sp. MAR_2009_124 TaxID=1250059 RepID=UPI0008955266|nr:DUF4133 domain-containing protein [Tenacibaculum sp. MAR_2009_124]SEC65394.1 protein of unknown function [Tenacibaculum sp. MAR_2009_124]